MQLANETIKLWGKRILVVGGLLFMILLVTDFNSRMAELTRLRAQKVEELQLRDELFATQYALQTQIAYASSDEAVDEWAREQERAALPGDFPVVPLADPNYQPPQPEVLEIQAQEHTHWENWMLWLIGPEEESSP
jgi:hypothetical protein